MNKRFLMNQVPSPLSYHRYWFWMIAILISLGILFRMIHLDHPVYWVDEVATSMRISGYTQADVTQHLATGLPLSPTEILTVQQIRPDGSIFNFLTVLSQSPEHAPLYFILMRGWAELFGTSVTAMRSLSVLFSLLTLPAIFSLCQYLFQEKAEGRRQKAEGEQGSKGAGEQGKSDPRSNIPNRSTETFGKRSVEPRSRRSPKSKIQNPLAALRSPGSSQSSLGSQSPHQEPGDLTPQRPNTQSKIQNPKSKIQNSLSVTALLAISPFFISYAQEARPYSLWVLLLVVWHRELWRSLHSNHLTSWLRYGLALTLSLYTSLLTVLVIVGQGLAVLLVYRKRWRPYLISTGMALVAFLPWCWVVITHWQTLQDNTSWMQEPMPLWALLGVWFYGLSVLFFDVPVAAGMPVVLAGQMLTSLVVMVVMLYAVYALMTDQRSIGLFLFLGALAPPMTLLTLDLIRDGQSAATPRYLMPMHLAVLIAVAYVVSDRLFYKPFTASPASAPGLRQSPSARAVRFWSLLTVALLSISLLSCLIGVTHTSDYQKSRNLSNPTILNLINQAQAPLVITEAGNVQDVISLSYGLNPDVRFSILPPQSNPEQWLPDLMSPQHPTFLFNPSNTMQKRIQDQQLGTLTPVYQPTKLISSELGLTLWQLIPNPK